MIHHTEHYSDRRLSPGQFTRRIGRWINYREPYGGWGAAAPGLVMLSSPPPNWEKFFDFERYSRRGALQIGIGDTSDPDNRAMIGLRRADQPEAWINLKAYDGVQAVPPQWDPSGLVTSFSGLWPNADVSFTANRHRFEKRIEMAVGAPTVYRWTLREASGLTREWQPNGSLLFRNANGDPVFVLPPPWATDANGDSVSVTMTEEDPVSIGGHNYPVLKLEVDSTGAKYPIMVDPTVVISGTTDVDDNYLNGISAGSGRSKNYGVRDTFLAFETPSEHRSIVRIVSPGSIPAGTISDLRLVFYSILTTGGLDLNAYFIADANNWVEGSSNGVQEAGASCWNYVATANPWAGGFNGCGLSGTDYDADATPPNIVVVSDAWNFWSLKPQWASDWRDGVRAPNGIVIFGPSGAVQGYTTEGAFPLYFEIDYTSPTLPGLIFDFGKNKRKNMRTDFVDLDAPQTPSEGTPVNVLEYTDKTVQITGNPTGLDVVIEGTMDGTNWAALTASITAVGFETIAATVKLIRVKLTTLTSGDYDVKFSGRLAR